MSHSTVLLNITLVMLHILVLDPKSWIAIWCRSMALTGVSLLFWYVISQIVWILVIMMMMIEALIIIVLGVFYCLRLDWDCMMTSGASWLGSLVLVVSQKVYFVTERWVRVCRCRFNSHTGSLVFVKRGMAWALLGLGRVFDSHFRKGIYSAFLSDKELVFDCLKHTGLYMLRWGWKAAIFLSPASGWDLHDFAPMRDVASMCMVRDVSCRRGLERFVLAGVVKKIL